jgi:hypothetical protein
LQPERSSHGQQRRQSRIAARRQGAIQAFAFDAGRFGDLRDANRLREMPQREEKRFRLVDMLERGFQVFDGELGIGLKLVYEFDFVRDAGVGPFGGLLHGFVRS